MLCHSYLIIFHIFKYLIFNYDSYLNVIRILGSFYLFCRVNVVICRVIINCCYSCFVSFCIILNIKYLIIFRNLFVVCVIDDVPYFLISYRVSY